MAARPTRRLILASAAAALAPLIGACDRLPGGTQASYKGIDITGADYARELDLPDTDGRPRTLADFRGKLVVVFFGYTQCPDVCPTTLSELVAARKLMGADGARVQGVFVTLDPERDSAEVLKAYVASFADDIVALRGSPAQIKAARATIAGRGSDLKLLNVTVLTSESSTFEQVKARAALSLEAGADGLICSGHETAGLREAFGKDAILVNPGIRPATADKNDQVRIVTPAQAIAAGATNLVVGRPITAAQNPVAVARAILAEIEAAHRAKK